MVCNYCGKEIPDDSTVCPFCDGVLHQKSESEDNENNVSENVSDNSVSENVSDNCEAENTSESDSESTVNNEKEPVDDGISKVSSFSNGLVEKYGLGKIAIAAGIFVLLIILLSVFVLKPNYSSLAKKEYSRENYIGAKYYFDKAGQTDNEQYTECLKHTMADYDYIETLQDAVIERYNSPNDQDLGTTIGNEFYKIVRFEDAEFYDTVLAEYAHDYYSADLLQKESLSMRSDGTYYVSDSEKFYLGRANRSKALLAISNIYPLFEGNEGAQEQYLNTGEYWVAYAAFSKAISQSLYNTVPTWSDEENCYYLKFTNTTNYTINAEIMFNYQVGSKVTSETVEITNLKPGASVDLLMKKAPESVESWSTSERLISAEKDGVILTEPE